VEGPLTEEWPPASYQSVFGDLPFEVVEGGRVQAQFADPEADARNLLTRFFERSLGRLISDEMRIEPYLNLYRAAIDLGENQSDALIAAFASALCSPDFLYMEAQPGTLDNDEIASRLSFFLWNSPPDQALSHAGNLRRSATLSEQTERMLSDPKSDRFLNAFLDYWLDLREINANTPDAELYPDYYLDDQLTEASIIETRRFFRELVDHDLPARNLVDSDFTFVNERLAQHYEFPVTEGVSLKRVDIPEDSPRGGLLTQASVLRVTANGTTTSPVLRGAWVMERIMGVHIPPPPSGIAAVEPDTRGATTIRDQLDKHRSNESCNACHAKFDPAGFALESFDVAGGWRDRYRAVGDIGEPVEGFGKNGHAYIFRYAEPVDPSGALADGRSFADINELKSRLLADERAIARNLARRLVVYATGANVSFADREYLERILDRSQKSQYGVRTLIHEVAQSELFKIK
jgi:hypothetical protein